MSIDWNGLNLDEIKEACFHQRPESLIKNVRAVSFALQPAEPLDDETGMQSIEAIHGHAVKVVNRPRRDDDLHRHSSVHCLVRRGCRVDVHVVITTRLIICLNSPRDVGDTRVGIRLLNEIDYLPAQRFRIVNCLPGK